MTTTHDIFIAEHGARRGTFYGSCGCGWSGAARRRQDLAANDCRRHVALMVKVARGLA